MATVTGGDKFQKVLDEITANLKAGIASVDVGFMSKTTEADGTLVAQVAAHNEYGTANSPPRPFFRKMIVEHVQEWPVNLATALKARNYNVDQALGLVGMRIRDQLRKTIIDFDTPPNAASTIARKGFDNPLIETKTMLKSATFKVNT